MIATHPLLAAALMASIIAVTAGCATSSSRPSDEDAPFALTEDYSDGVISYTVQRGDRLSDIALEFTGDVSLWKQIADYNGIEDPRSLRAGSVLQISGDLIPGYAEGLAARRQAESSEPVSAASPGSADVRVIEPLDQPVAQPETIDVQPPVSNGLAIRRVPPVEISTVDVNRDFNLSPIDTPAPDVSEPRRIKVVGSYTPKGVYAQPASYSRLMMRVAPGTVFDVESENSGWYGVTTEAGTGYLRTGDARPLDE